MGATLDELEDRISPAHIRDEVQHSVRRTIDDVRAEYSPTKMAKRAQNTMFETIKDNPIPALAAGLSVGYLIMKGAERSDDVRGDYPRRGRYDVGYEGRSPGYYETRETYAAERPNRVRARSEYVASEEFVGDDPSGRSAGDRVQESADEARERMGEARERTGEMTREARERTGEMTREVAERTGEMREEASERARHAAYSAERRTKQAARQARQKAVAAEHSLEDFVYDNPLAAGALAIGVGALLGGLFPSTKMEDEWLGPARDEAVGRAKRAAEASMESGRESAKKVMHEAKESARDVTETAKSEAKKTAETAKDRAASDSGETTSDLRGRSDAFRPKTSDSY